jgi:hypothetical protein
LREISPPIEGTVAAGSDSTATEVPETHFLLDPAWDPCSRRSKRRVVKLLWPRSIISFWEMIALAYDYELDDASERRHAARLVRAMMWQLADIGAVICGEDDVVLTGLGKTLASAAAAMSSDGDVD